MFLGQYSGELKQVNRLILPAGFHNLTPHGVYVTQGFDRNLLVLKKSTFDHLYQNATALNIADPLARLFLRMFLGSAKFQEIGLDDSLDLPEGLVQFADLKQAVMIVGQGEYFELWSADLWEQQKEQLKDFQANAQRFSAFRIVTH